MKRKPLLITLGIVAALAVVLLVVKGRNASRPEKNGVLQFLTAFNRQLQAGNADSLLNCFDVKQKTAVLMNLLNVLANKSVTAAGVPPSFKVALDIDKSKIKIFSSGNLAEARIPVTFASDTVAARTSALKFRIKKVSKTSYKIVQIDANKMMEDYLSYDNLLRSKNVDEAAVFADITLKSFKIAASLKGKYDTVVWFAHLDNKTYYYVVNGKWDQDLDVYHYKDTVIGPYKMGLLGPDLKEIIPVQYDLIHNINATFPGLIEVEKNDKKGFYDLNGKNVIAVNYNQIFPIVDADNLAVLRNGDDYFYLKKDYTVSQKVDLKVSDFFTKIRDISTHLNLYKNALSVITEYNSTEKHGAVYVPPSYLADLNMISKLENFKNPLRKGMQDADIHADYNIGFSTTVKDESNWLEASFYAVRDYYLGGRAEFYDRKNLVILDKKRNKLYTQNIATSLVREEDDGGSLEGVCDVSNIKVLNDSMYEVKVGAVLYADMYDSTKTLTGGPYYHYLVARGNKLVELPNERYFGFTKYVKIDDSYMNGCYKVLIGPDYKNSKEKTIDRVTPEMLRYIKNEIYADYGYQFKDKRWQAVFQNMPSYKTDDQGNPIPGKANVNDSLTEIDKYNINWITQKLKGGNANKLASK